MVLMFLVAHRPLPTSNVMNLLSTRVMCHPCQCQYLLDFLVKDYEALFEVQNCKLLLEEMPAEGLARSQKELQSLAYSK
jgi:hypothetical protein